MKICGLNVVENEHNIVIEGTSYSPDFFKEFGCSFPENVGQILRIDKKEDGVLTVTRLHDLEKNSA